MNKITGPIIMLAGFILAFGGVGGVELSETTSQLLVSTGIAVLGLLAMYAGTELIKHNDQY